MVDPLYRPLPDSFDERVAPPPPPPPKLRRDWTLPGWTLVWFVAMGATLLGIVPRFSEVFEQVKVPMPWATEVLCSFARFVGYAPWLWFGTGFLAVVAATRAPGKRVPFAGAFCPFLFMLSFAWVVYALFLPLIGCGMTIGRS